jgi:hypothetical protein
MKTLKLILRNAAWVVLAIWQLPQTILALIVLRANRKQSGKAYTIDSFCMLVRYPDGFRRGYQEGISLGMFIFLDERKDFWTTVSHEYGHVIQSRILGPLYLPTIGLLSISGAIIWSVFKLNPRNYYRLPWEWLADKMGGVRR